MREFLVAVLKEDWTLAHAGVSYKEDFYHFVAWYGKAYNLFSF